MTNSLRKFGPDAPASDQTEYAAPADAPAASPPADAPAASPPPSCTATHDGGGPREVWERHKPEQPSQHRRDPAFGGWIEPNAARVTDDPSGLGSLVAARALAPAMLEPAIPARLNEIAGYWEANESTDPDHPSVLRRVEPFEDVPRAPLKALSNRERKRLRSSEERYTELAMQTSRAMARWAAWWRELGESTEQLPPLADPESYAICRAIVCSREAADAALKMIGESYGGNVLWRVMRSAFGDPAAPQWDTRSLCGRRQLALDLWMIRQSRLKFTGKRDRFGRPILQPCVWGIGRSYLQALLADPDTCKPLSRERLTHSNDSCDGLFKKAELARVFVRQSRIPPEVADEDEIGPSGYTFNRYWVCRHFNPKAALRDEPDGHDAQGASDRAWAWFHAGVRAALRGRFVEATASVDRKWVAREAPS